MPRIQSFELLAVDLPFRHPFKHAAASRQTSSSLFLKCTTDSGVHGFGECLPRPYVTGETQDGGFALLADTILPKLIGRRFERFSEVADFLDVCDGKAPAQWLDPGRPQTAAWCAVDLALLDCFGRAFKVPVRFSPHSRFPARVKYSMVVSSDAGIKTLALIRLAAFSQVKIKVEGGHAAELIRRARRILGAGCDLRVDANMAWDTEEALQNIKFLNRLGVGSFEQPLTADNIPGLALLVERTGQRIMADESLHDRESLEDLIARRACTAVNVRISKCGGLTAARNRCRRALEAGLIVQVGCQVGESSLLSAAHLILIRAVRQVTYAEGCFGHLLLKEDPAYPVLQFGFGGRAPRLPVSPGLGVSMNEAVLLDRSVRRVSVH